MNCQVVLIKKHKNKRCGGNVLNKIPVEKNKEYVVDIVVDGALKGEKIKILIVKVLSSHAFR